MQNLHRKQRLIATALLLGSLVNLQTGLAQAADGSERIQRAADHAISTKAPRLAEDGSERSRRNWFERAVEIAEGGAERIQATRKA